MSSDGHNWALRQLISLECLLFSDPSSTTMNTSSDPARVPKSNKVARKLCKQLLKSCKTDLQSWCLLSLVTSFNSSPIPPAAENKTEGEAGPRLLGGCISESMKILDSAVASSALWLPGPEHKAAPAQSPASPTRSATHPANSRLALALPLYLLARSLFPTPRLPGDKHHRHELNSPQREAERRRLLVRACVWPVAWVIRAIDTGLYVWHARAD